MRHNFNVGGSYAIPGGEKVGGGPLQIGTVFTALSGRPFTPGVGTFDRSGQNTGWLRADCLADPIYNYDLSYLFPDANTTRSVVTNAATAFATPANGTLGSCGRNSGRRPGLAQLDMNILKEFNPVVAQGGPRAMQWAVKVLF